MCSPKCQKKGSSTSLRCFGPQDSECCDEDCAAGCWGDFRYECHVRILESNLFRFALFALFVANSITIQQYFQITIVFET